MIRIFIKALNIMKLKSILKLAIMSVLVYLIVEMYEGSYYLGNTKTTNVNNIARPILQNPKESQTRCQYGYFKLPGMEYCHPWLNCSDFKKDITSMVQLKDKASYAKKIFRALWRDHQVVVNIIPPSHYNYTGVEVVKEFQPSEHIIQLVGTCNHTFVTQYHQYGNAVFLNNVLLLPNLRSRNNIKTRLQICVSYIEVINFLHTLPGGPRVFCDSPNLIHTLSQFLITDDLRLVLNDLDFLYHINSKGKKTTDCNPLGLDKSFNPPESFIKPRRLNEKFDVWKIPNICDHMIGRRNTSVILQELNRIKRQCKEEKPSSRPTSSEVLAVYKSVLNKLMELP